MVVQAGVEVTFEVEVEIGAGGRGGECCGA